MHAGNVTYLSSRDPGETGIVHSLTGGHGSVSRPAGLGFLTPGGKVTVMQSSGHAPIILLVRSSRIALGQEEAMKVWARKLVERG
jgi:Fe2+ transport system protein FeoA